MCSVVLGVCAVLVDGDAVCLLIEGEAEEIAADRVGAARRCRPAHRDADDILRSKVEMIDRDRHPDGNTTQRRTRHVFRDDRQIG